MSTVAAMLRAAEEFEKIKASIDWVEVEKMRQACMPAMVEARKVLASPWVAEAMSVAERALREQERLVAATRVHQPLETSLADSLWLAPSPRWAAPALDLTEPPDPPKRRIGFAPWDD